MYILGVIVLFYNLSIIAAEIQWLATPQHKVILFEDDLILNCSAIDTEGGTLTYEWFLNDTTVPDKHSIFANHSLLIPRLSEDDLGDYRCDVTSTTGLTVSSDNATVILAYIEKFEIRPQSFRVFQGDSITMTCVTGRSAPPPTTYWELNGEPFKEGVQLNSTYGDSDPTRLSQQYSMKLDLIADREYRGIYRCVAINSLLQHTMKSEDATIFVDFKSVLPTVVTYFEPETIIAEGQQVLMDCDHEGYPAPTVWWFHNGNLLDDTLQRFFYPNGSLAFNPILLKDNGSYYCEVFNFNGRVRSNTTNITVTTLGISFEKEPSDMLIFAGQSATLKCVPPISIPPANVTWYKDYQPLTLRMTGTTSVSIAGKDDGIWDLQFSNVQRQDEGVYFCVASNTLAIPTSRTSRTATLSVEGSPSIIQPPSDTRLIKGRLLTLVCKVHSKPAATVSWLFQNLPLKSTSKITYSNNNQELNIGDIGKADEGTYTCVAKNSYGEKRADAIVTITVPPVRVRMLGNVVYRVDQTAVIPCNIYGDPPPTVTWYKDNIKLSNVVMNSDQSLVINKIQTSDEGAYSCYGINEGGSIWSNGTVRLLVPPDITEGPKETTVLIGQPTKLNCLVIGYPQPKVEWMLNGTSITSSYPGGITISETGEYLNIKFVTWQHVGVYTCMASSSEGSDSHLALLHLNVPASIDRIIGDNVKLIKQEINLRCSAQGIPTPSITWKHKGKIIQSGLDGRISFPSAFTIKIKFATVSDAGLMSCEASNNIGTSSKTVELFVIDTPKPPLLAGAYPMSKSSVSLSWLDVKQLDYTNVTYYRIYYKQRLSEEFILHPEQILATLTSYEIGGLQSGQEYIFTMASENEVGIGSMSSALLAITYDSGPTEPKAIKVVNIQARALTLSWEIPKTTNGEIRKYQLYYEKKNSNKSDKIEIFNPAIPTQTFTINKLHPHSLYEIRVRAGNIQNGRNIWGSFSLTLVVRTAIDKPEASPADLKATVLTSNSVLLQWKHLPDDKTNGPILEYVITYNTSTDQSDKRIQSNIETVSVNKLSPWTIYSFQIKAENEAGTGPNSGTVTVKTYPQVPSGPPGNVKVLPISSDTLQIYWQEPNKSTWNSEINGYKIQYKLTTDKQWTDIVINRVDKLSYTLNNLEIWSKYDIRVAVFTLLVVPGTGPYSNIVTSKTLQSAPGMIDKVSYNSSFNSVMLSWLPPHKQNGVILYYLFKYYRINETVLDEKSIKVNTTSYMLEDLEANTQYNLSIEAVNDAGHSLSQSYLLQTAQEESDEPIEYTSTSITTDNSAEGSTDVIRDPGEDKPPKNLPVIVGGCLTAGIFVLFIIILIIYKCIKKRRSDRENYVISSGFKSKRLSSINERDESFNTDVTSQQVREVSTDEQHQYFQYGSVTTPASTSGASQLQDSETEIPSLTVTPPNNNNTDNKPGKLKRPESFSGLDNPNYLEDEVFSATLPRPHTTASMTSEELYAKMGDKLKKNRMRSGSAAAIAILRNSSLAISANDTDSLVNNDSVVIYNERTVL